MTIWKKAVSALVTAGLLASMTASAAFATTGAFASDSDQTDVLDCSIAAVHNFVTCAQVADGISTVTLVGDDGVAAGSSTYISASGATIIAVSGGDFVLAGGVVTAPDGATLDAGDSITLRAPATAGTGVVSVYLINTSTGVSSLEGTLTITFTATSGLNVSEANSSVKIDSDISCATQVTPITQAVAALPAAPAAGLCLTLKDGNGQLVAGTPSVAVTITPVGLMHFGAAYPAGTNGQVVSTTAAAGVANFQIINTGLAGVATIGISITQGTTVTTFAPKTFTFTGAVSSIVATAAHSAILISGSRTGAVTFVAKDANGNVVPTTAANVVTTGSVYTAPVQGAAVTTQSTASADTPGTVDVTCGATAGSGTIAIKQGTITSNAVTVYCSTAADTYAVAFDKTSVVPGGQATINVTVKDAGGRPAPDGLSVSIVVSSGAFLATTAGVTKNGVASWTFLAPFNTGVVTVLASATVLTSTSPQSASINVSAVVSNGTARSALGVTTSGPFSLTTKIAALNKYVTVKISFGSGAAGQHVGIWTAKKNSAGVWSAFTQLTGRVANSNGDVYFYWRSSSTAWLSIRGALASAKTNAVQARWR